MRIDIPVPKGYVALDCRRLYGGDLYLTSEGKVAKWSFDYSGKDTPLAIIVVEVGEGFDLLGDEDCIREGDEIYSYDYGWVVVGGDLVGEDVDGRSVRRDNDWSDAMAKGKYKYSTYSELAKAFESGELDREKYVLVMDNDCCSLSYRGDDMEEDEAYEHAKSLFSGGGYGDIVEVCEAAGIPSEWC